MDETTAVLITGLIISGISLLGHIVCGLISNRINVTKGYNGGFLWGFLLGILGIAITAVRPYRQ